MFKWVVFKKKNKPLELFKLQGLDGKKSRRRPTLAGPIVRLPLARQRFTSGFGTGPGGTTALWPPGFRGELLCWEGLHPACPAPLLGVLFWGGIFLVFVVWQGDFFPV